MSTKKSEITPINHLDSDEYKWFAIHTRYKREKQVSKRLDAAKIENYLPLQHVARKYASKVKHVELPLIPCFNFVKIVKSEYIQVLNDPDVVKFVRIRKDLISIPEDEIDILKRIVNSSSFYEVDSSKLTMGKKVEIVNGNLTGLTGKIIDKHGQKLCVELNNIGFNLIIQVNPEWVSPIK